MLKLRPYQSDLIEAARGAWRDVGNVLAVLPTGGGKTVIFSSEMLAHKGACAAVVHRKEIVAQISLSLGRMGVKHRIVAPPQTVALIRKKHYAQLDKSYVDQSAPAGVVSVQTLTSRSAEKNPAIRAWVQQVTLAVYDEGHHYVDAGKWSKSVHMFDKARKLFVTATPERADKKGLGAHASGFVERMVEGPTTRWLIDNGYLSPFRYYAPASDLDVTGVAVTASGEFNAKALRARVVDSHLVGDVVRHFGTYGENGQFIVFSSDVMTAEEIAAKFREHGRTCEALSGETEQGVRDAELKKFEDAQTQGLTNVGLFDEGFDVPAVRVVIDAQPTESLGKYLQKIGRALRPEYAPGYDLSTKEGRLAAIANGPKPYAIVIDPVRNWERHGLPDWPRVWSLDDRASTRGNSEGTIPSRICTGCTQVYEAYLVACPYCGHVETPPERTEVTHVDGDLLALDVDALAALFKQRDAASMSADEFEQHLIQNNVPPIARPRIIKKHEAAKYRREVLHNLVGWWFGAQPAERPQSEKYKRFYLRFGVDVVTAFTLDEKQTDNLIEKITKGFHYDMA